MSVGLLPVMRGGLASAAVFSMLYEPELVVQTIRGRVMATGKKVLLMVTTIVVNSVTTTLCTPVILVTVDKAPSRDTKVLP